MKNTIFAFIAIALMIPSLVDAQVVFPNRGGTGNSTTPAFGELLVGNSNGTYTLTATSSLGFSGTGSVTSVNMTTPTGLVVTGVPITAAGTIALALDTGYFIPLVASSTNWETAYGWGDHSSAGYLTGITGQSIESLSDVASFSQSLGDLLYWNGSAWSNIATSSLGISGGGGGTWGSITGTLSDQTDLQSALNAKTDTSTTSLSLVTSIPNLSITESQISDLSHWATTSSNYWESQQTARTADDLTDNDTADLAEGSNLYYTLARVQSALTGGYNAIFGSATTTHATSTNQAISGLLTFDGVTGSAWTDFCTAITGGSGLCDGTDNTGGGAGLATSTAIADTYVIYGTSASDVGAESAFTYNDATDLLTAVNGTFSGTLTGTLTGNADTATALFANGANCLSGSAPLGVDASGAVENCFDVWTEAENTSAGYISNLSGFDTGDLTEGSNLYWTNNRFDARLNATTSLPNLTVTESQISDLQSYLTGVAWGDITGTLSSQTDLQTALNGKTDTSSTTLGVVTSIPNLSITESQISDLGSYLTGNQTITLSGDVTGSGATAITTAIGSGVIVENDLNINAPTNGYALLASSTASGGFEWASVSGSGDVTAASSFSADNQIIRADGTGKGVQSSGITINDAGYIKDSGGFADRHELYFVESANISLIDDAVITGLNGFQFDPQGGDIAFQGASILQATTTLLYGLILDSTPNADHRASGEGVSDIKASTTLAIGDIVYLNSVGAWELSDASATSTSQGWLGVALEAATNNGTLPVATDGSFVRDDTWAWTIGQPLYLSETAGDLTHTPPTTSGAVVRRFGYAVSADVVKIDIGEVISLQ